MKFIADENVSYLAVLELRSRGHQVISVSEGEFSGSPDQEIYNLMVREGAILITRDFHFTNSLRFNPKGTAGIVYLRKGNLKSEEEAIILLDFISRGGVDLVKDRLVTLDRTGIRIR
ncbi:MAG: DUF5615 family PIN-like protein [Proteobacteria bacterium]|nr:DUF5615 family PIN-like protein [Pseudomonadota bacterium]